jgi:Cytochrome c7 and related cytochrome c/Class III cytochrome C family
MLAVLLFMVYSGQVPAEQESFSFKKLLMPGSVVEGHAEFEKVCSKCHENFSGDSQTSLCLDCHKEVNKDIQQSIGFHGRLANANNRQCIDCHGEHVGREGDIVNLDKDSFDHSATDFELTGKHIAVQCVLCHQAEKKFREAPDRCFDCHESDDRHQGVLDNECHNCHSSQGWAQAQFDHNETAFSLLGKHKDTQCSACHPDEKYKDTPTQCHTCHTLNDVHNGANGDQCDQCHQEIGWDNINFDHDKDTNFKLTGRHAKQRCESCHEVPGFKKQLNTACIDCHRNDDEHNARNGEQCASCHETSRWNDVHFDHGRDTDFTLQGKHSKLTCESCHRDRAQEGSLGTACIDCHDITDVHKGQQGRQCDHCHNAAGWRKKVRFNHDLTPFPLVGMHAVTSCESCHASKQFRDAPNQCVECHQQQDSHQRALGPNCADCHNPNDWALWLFDHNTQTKFTLEHAHDGLSCNQCHRKPAKTHIKQSSVCAACHLRDDPHNRRFGRACERCHTTSSFDELEIF